MHTEETKPVFTQLEKPSKALSTLEFTAQITLVWSHQIAEQAKQIRQTQTMHKIAMLSELALGGKCCRVDPFGHETNSQQARSNPNRSRDQDKGMAVSLGGRASASEAVCAADQTEESSQTSTCTQPKASCTLLNVCPQSGWLHLNAPSAV